MPTFKNFKIIIVVEEEDAGESEDCPQDEDQNEAEEGLHPDRAGKGAAKKSLVVGPLVEELFLRLPNPNSLSLSPNIFSLPFSFR